VRDLKVVLVAGPQDHGPGEHDYPAWQERWKSLLGGAPGVEVTTADRWPGKDQWRDADLMVLYLWNHDWSPERLGELDAFLARGGGVVALHAALIADKEPEALARRFGLSAQPVRTKYRHGPLDLEIAAPAGHPVTKGQKAVRYVDETYWPMVGDATKVEVLATAVEEDKAHPMMWTFGAGKGRVFGSVLGHYSWTFDDPLFRLWVLRGMAWAVKEPASRFDALSTVGVKLREGH
jgi:type 1 glutamine amidotransferase